MPSPIAADARFAQLLAADAALTAPGAPFEIVVEDVLGATMPVFAGRPRSLRELLTDAANTYDDRDLYVWSDGRRSTFGGIVQEVADVAAGPRDEFGVGKAHRVAISASNCPEWC
jgi:hypothetical protein